MNSYAPDSRLSPADVDNDVHRDWVGGMWDEIGRLQFDFMRERAGLTPEMKLLDLGCGCFRGGVHFLRYMRSGHYYGLDVNASLVQAGFDAELPRHGLQGRLDPANVVIRSDFDASGFGVRFDRILAVSVWTHLPLNHIQRSLAEAARVLKPGGALYASIFVAPPQADLLGPVRHEPGGIVSHRDRDPYHHRLDDFEHLVRQASLPLRAMWIGEWRHPRNQQMVAFERLS